MTLFNLQRNARAERRALGNRKSRKQARKELRWRRDFVGKPRAERLARAAERLAAAAERPGASAAAEATVVAAREAGL